MKNFNAENHRIAFIYWSQAEDDLKISAENIKKNPLFAMITANQAVTNCLSAICFAKNKSQPPAYNLVEMVEFCSQIDKVFLKLKNACLDLDAVQEEKITNLISAKKAKVHYKKALLTVYQCQKIAIKLKIIPFYQLKNIKLRLLLKQILYGWQKSLPVK